MTLPSSLSDISTDTPPLSENPVGSILLGVAGGMLVAGRGRFPRSTRNVAAAAGLALLGVAAYGPLAVLIRRAGTGRRAARLRLSFVVDQPVERVFAFCRDFENYPRFVGALRSVQDHGDGRSKWCASTPAGDTLEWNAITTKYVPNRVIAWETVAGSPVHATGLLRFMPENGRTCIQVLLTYELVGTSPMKDALASLVAAPRSRQLEADIGKLVAYLDTAPEAELSAYGV
jgi:uncharacterized membrane protein